MQLGDFMVIVTLIVTIGAIAAYIGAALGRRELTSLGRTAYLGSAVAVVGISAYFMWLILTNHFELEYIFNNSSKALSLYYKVSVFWAGQQGSFLFWALCGALLGLVVMRKAREFEPWMMVFWSAIQGLFLMLLLIDSPFKPMPTGMPIADGQGLRELLQNPWMAIHPPLVFIGYAAMSVPAAFAVAALLNNNLKTWVKTTLPWAVFGWITLGAGIIIGAYWAYEVLGWGGYWGWDPVENASLIPWLTGTALLHGMIAERYRCSFRRANILLALVTFLFVFYATFLTRSDALKDFSVHTFGDARIGGPLIYFMGTFILFSAIITAWRWRTIKSAPSYTTLASKDFLFFLAVISFVASAAFVLIGTSAPIIGKLASHVPLLNKVIPAKINVDLGFYNRTNAPIALIVLGLMTLAPIIAWKRGKSEEGQQGPGLLIAVGIVAIAAIALKLNLTIIAVAIAFAGLAALVTNAYTVYRTSKIGLRLLGGYAAHTGMGLLFVGVILSAAGGQSKTITLIEGAKPVESHGYRLSYEGTKQFSERMSGLNVRVERGGKVVHAVPTMQITRDNEIMAKPHIVKTFGQDLYIAPKSIPGSEQKVLSKDQAMPVQDFQLKFVGFDLPSGHGQGDVRIGAKIEAQVNGKTETVIPFLVTKQSPATSGVGTEIPGMGATVRVDRVRVEEKSIEATFTPKDSKPQPLILKKGETVSSGSYRVTFKEWFFSEGGHEGGGGLQTRIQVSSGGKDVTVEAPYEPSGAAAEPMRVSDPITVPGADATVALLGVDVNNGQVLVSVTPTVDVAVVDVSVKPFISLLWIGSILALIGGGIAMWRRNADAARPDKSSEEEFCEIEPVEAS